MRSLASRPFRFRVAAFDVFLAAVAGPAALFVREVDFQTVPVALYTLVSFAFSLFAFLAFRIREGLAHHVSVHDAMQVFKAVLTGQLLTAATLFVLFRLEGIPRSVPVIHALILIAGLAFYRIVIRLWHDDRPESESLARYGSTSDSGKIVLVGCNKLSSLYMKLLKAYAPKKRRVVAILDGEPRMMGRSIEGVQVVGSPDSFDRICQEFAEHGIEISQVLVGGSRSYLSADTLDVLSRTCADRGYRLDFIPELLGLEILEREVASQLVPTASKADSEIALPRYFRVKRVVDVLIALVLVAMLFPVLLLVAGLVLLDVGSPILFWQQRVGRRGQVFLVYKFRTLRPLFTDKGLPIGTSGRLSAIGALIRKTRLDELPQLLNVLVGDMSLIGPRPLLPRDQPADPSLRLAVRPGITGWAQINGGKLLSPEDKNDLDEWYVKNASVWLDLQILFRTIRVVFRAEPDPNTSEPLKAADPTAIRAEMSSAVAERPGQNPQEATVRAKR